MSQSIPDAFRAAARQHADQTIVWHPKSPLTFAQLDQDSDRVAAALHARGLQQGDRVALYAINDKTFVQAYLGIQKAGCVVVPVNLLIGVDEVSYVLGNAKVSAFIYHAAMTEKAVAVKGQLEGLKATAVIGDAHPEIQAESFADWLSVEAAAPSLSLNPEEDVAAILYTSGTTGNPKGAMLTHHNLVSNTQSVKQALGLQSGKDRLLVVLPMFHSFAATVGILTPCLHGLSITPVPKFDPVLVSDMIAASRATIFLGVPSMYAVVNRLPDEQAAKFKTIRFGVAGGAAMPVELLKSFESRYDIPVLEGDGPTECSPVTCVNPFDGERKAGSVGLPVPNVSMTIRDLEGHEVATGEMGEICVAGPNVMKGYWELPEATAETFFGEWLRTGDLGYIDEDGYIFMVDRIKDMIIVNGMNVYPRQIEEVLHQHEAVLEAAVVGQPHASHGEIVVAYVVPAEGHALTEAEIKQFCKERLGQHQLPRRVEIRDGLPKNASGKILKRELRKEGEVERGIN